ncbi:MAG: hypothetical protein E5Y69_36545 [Mesorhizobium sp.]|nr:MAG: hypothetical protein E5Y69_36545 [Mesorhizobium sp.]
MLCNLGKKACNELRCPSIVVGNSERVVFPRGFFKPRAGYGAMELLGECERMKIICLDADDEGLDVDA